MDDGAVGCGCGNKLCEDGGPAFPRRSDVVVNGLGETVDLIPAQRGLTKREWFAGMALSGLLADPEVDGNGTAIAAVAFADDLIEALAARDKGGES